MHILIVDDNPTNRKLLRAILETEGFTVTDALDGEEALKLLKTAKADAVISDVLMPRMEGFGLCYELRRQKKYSTIPFLFLTASYTSPSDEKLALEIGADRMLKRPISSKEILSALRELFNDVKYTRPRNIHPTKKIDVIREYSEALVAKLEEKNTELEKKTEELKKFLSAIEQTADSIVVTTRDGVIEYVNPAFEKNSGYTREEALGKTPSILKSGKHDTGFYKKLWNTILSGKMFREEFTNKRKNGDLFVEEQTIIPIFDDNGQIINFVSSGRDITERIRAENELHQSHETLQRVIDNIPQYVFWKDKNSNYLGSNTIFAKSAGLETAKAIVGKNDIELTWKESAEAYQADDKLVIETGIPKLNYEEEQIRSDGSILWVRTSKVPLFDRQGEVLGVLGVYEDITEHKHAVEALRESELQFRQLTENIHEVFWLTDPKKNSMLYVSPAYEGIWGRTPESLYASPLAWLEAIYPEDRERIHQAAIKKQISGTYDEEYRIVRPDGSIRWIRDRAFPVKNPDGEVYRIAGVAEDITEQKKKDEALRHSEEQFRLIAENVADFIAVHDITGKRLFSSPSYHAIFGDPKLLVGTYPFNQIHPDDREKIKNIFKETVRTGVGQRAEFRIIAKDGSEHFMESQGSAIRDEKGDVSQVIVVSRDITERKKLELQLLQAQRMESIGVLAGGIAHDLNNVLSPIMMGIDILKRKNTDKEIQKILQTIETSATRGSGMIRQVLTFARGLKGERAVLQMGHLVAEMEKIIRETFPKSIRFSTDVTRDLWTISGDATQLHQILLNLCVNARDAMPNGGELKISAKNFLVDQSYAEMQKEANAGPYIVLSIADSGTGIPAGVLPKIFDPFFTTKEIGKGTGLGLSTVQSIVKSHGGFLTVQSEQNKGTVFQIFIPAQSTPAEIQPLGKQIELLQGHGELILVVDDEASIRDICRVTLESFGYTVITASEGTDALTQFIQHKDDIKLVITDMMMPFMDGQATIRVLLKIDPLLKIIATSGLMAEEKNLEYENLPVKAFLPKPYTAETLLTTVSNTLAGKDV